MKTIDKYYFPVKLGNIDFIIHHIRLPKCYYMRKNPHWHAYYEIHCIISGRINVYVEDKIFKAEENDMYIIPPNTVHNQIPENDSQFLEGIIAFSIKGNLHNSEYYDGLTLKESKDISNILTKNRFMVIHDLFKTKDEFYKIEKEILDKKAGYYTKCKNIIINILINMARNIEYLKKIEYDLPEKSDEQIRILKLENLIFIQNEEYKNLNELAEKMSISKRHLSRLIYTQYNMTYSQLMNKIKIEQAKYLLRTTKMTVENISSELGYCSAGYFRKLFKKLTGCTPTSYKSRNT